MFIRPKTYILIVFSLLMGFAGVGGAIGAPTPTPTAKPTELPTEQTTPFNPKSSVFKRPPFCAEMNKFRDGVCGSSDGELDGMIGLTKNGSWQSEILSGASPKSLWFKSAYVGEDFHTMAMVTRAKADAREKIRIACDLWIVKPNGSLEAQGHDERCHEGRAGPASAWVVMQNAGNVFSFSETDPVGSWIFIMVARDLVARSAVLMWTRVENLGLKGKR